MRRRSELQPFTHVGGAWLEPKRPLPSCHRARGIALRPCRGARIGPRIGRPRHQFGSSRERARRQRELAHLVCIHTVGECLTGACGRCSHRIRGSLEPGEQRITCRQAGRGDEDGKEAGAGTTRWGVSWHRFGVDSLIQRHGGGSVGAVRGWPATERRRFQGTQQFPHTVRRFRRDTGAAGTSGQCLRIPRADRIQSHSFGERLGEYGANRGRIAFAGSAAHRPQPDRRRPPPPSASRTACKHHCHRRNRKQREERPHGQPRMPW